MRVAKPGARLLCGLVCLLASALGADAAEKSDPEEALRAQQALQAILMGYADKYMSAVAQAYDEVRAAKPDDPEARNVGHGYRLHIARAVQGIATSPNPEVALLDMVVFASLHRRVFEDAWAREVFGEERERFVDAMRRLEDEIWGVAARYLTDEEQFELRRLVTEWRREHPEMRYVFYIRFADFAEGRQESKLAQKARKGGFLVNLSDATRAADEAVLLGERALQMTQHMPLLVSWEIESLFYRLAASIEAQQALDQSAELTRAANRFAAVAEALPDRLAAERKAAIEQLAEEVAEERADAIRDAAVVLATERSATFDDLKQVIASERAALFAEVDARQAMLSGAMSEVRAGLADADKLAATLGDTTVAVNEALLSADRLMARFDTGGEAKPAAAGEPFDINAYTEAIRELTVAIQEANTLVLATERFVGAEAPIVDIFDRVLWTGALLILILCIAAFFTMLVYRAAARRLFAERHQP